MHNGFCIRDIQFVGTTEVCWFGPNTGVLVVMVVQDILAVLPFRFNALQYLQQKWKIQGVLHCPAGFGVIVLTLSDLDRWTTSAVF